jgi:hypothetical protein
MKLALALVVLVAAAQAGIGPERAKSPSDATVFVRLVGSIHAEIDVGGMKRSVDRDHVEIATGSGFVISPYGYVLTNEHVVSSGEFVTRDGSAKITITPKDTRLEVCLTPELSAVRGMPLPCTEASVTASDPALDLAVLLISTPSLPYLALGDSDVVAAGQPIDALGYPLGRKLEIGRATSASDVVPDVSSTPGTISALRAGDNGERRYVQISSNVNPGNSGGPVVDRDGFAVGVIQARLAKASGIGFAIPINLAKDFLASRGLDNLMPTRRLRLGPTQSLEPKGMTLRLPEGLADRSPFRSRVEASTQPDGIGLKIDRVFSPWSLKQLEQNLVGTSVFERVSIATRESQISSRLGDRLLLGRASGTAAEGDSEIRMDYAVLDLGAEKLVARFVGPSADVAFNESVLWQSLASLEGQRLVTADPDPVDKVEWSPVAVGNGLNRVLFPVGWVVEPGAPSACQGLPQTTAAAAASPTRDFTVALRVAIWADGGIVPDEVASACSARKGLFGSTSYASRGDWLGVSYTTEGVFIQAGPRQIMQLEAISPAPRNAYAHALIAAWIKKATVTFPPVSGLLQ